MIWRITADVVGFLLVIYVAYWADKIFEDVANEYQMLDVVIQLLLDLMLAAIFVDTLYTAAKMLGTRR